MGSGCYDAKAFRHAVEDVRKAFDVAADIGFDMDVVDVGGGFPGTEDAKITIHEVYRPCYPYHVFRYLFKVLLNCQEKTKISQFIINKILSDCKW